MKHFRVLVLAAALVVPLRSTAQVYFNDFSNLSNPLTEWSLAPTTSAPSGERFLGHFSSGDTTLTLPLPAGTQSVTLSFDLYVINSWDGQGPEAGPDTWGVRIAGGPTLLQETFNNMEGLDPWGPQGQSFGGQGQPAGTYTARTGASAIDTLGIASGEFWGNRDSTYSLSFSFPYAQTSLAINFFDLGLQGVSDESWGLDNVSVQAIPEPSGLLLMLSALGLFAVRRMVRAGGTRTALR